LALSVSQPQQAGRQQHRADGEGDSDGVVNTLSMLCVLAGSVRRRAIPAAGSLSLGGGEGDGVRLPGGTKV
jgi:hypothetical protein